MIGYRNSSCTAVAQAGFEAGFEPRIVFRSDDNTTIHQLLDTMYRQVRRALGNLNDRKAITKFPDPLLDMQINKVTFAWNTIRRPVDGFFNSPAKEEWKAAAAQDLQITMATLRQVEAVLP